MANDAFLFARGPNWQYSQLADAIQTPPTNVSMSYPSSRDPNNPTITTYSAITLRANATDTHSGLSYDKPFAYWFAVYTNGSWSEWMFFERAGDSTPANPNANMLFAFCVEVCDNDGNKEISDPYYLKYVPIPTLSYITISGATTVNENSGAQYTCTAYYSDGSSANVSSSASWSENSSYATINSSGYLTTSEVPSDQSCRITATYGGKSDTHDLTIKNIPPTLSYITITGATTVNENSGAQYTCTAYYSDGSSVNVSSSASWSANSLYATINSSGYLTTSEVPSDQPCRIAATYGGKSDAHDLTIKNIPPTLSYITISGATTVNENSGAQYTCTAYYSDGSSVNVNSSASWSENSLYATINSSGYLTTSEVPSDQPCRITATYGGQSDTHDFTIKNVVIEDTQPPTLQITAPTTAPIYSSPTATMNIGGTASDDVGVTSVKVKNFRDVGEYTCIGTTNWQFNSLPLFQGTNHITATAFDVAGNSQNDSLKVTYKGDPQYDDVLRSGGIVQELTFPDNLAPGSTVTVRWKILSYIPIVARVYAGIPGGWTFYRNGTYTGYAVSPWNLNGRHAGIYSFECNWPVPQKSGEFKAWLNVAQMDHGQYMIPVLPDGVDSRPDPEYAKLIQRTILPGGDETDPISDPDLYNPEDKFETVEQHKKRAGATVTAVTLTDNLTQGAKVTCTWKILSYVPVNSQLLMLNLAQEQVWLTTNATKIGSPVQTTYHFQDRTTETQCNANEYTFRVTFDVPNQPGTQQIFFRCQESAKPSSSWMGANLSADIDPRPAQYNGMYGRFIERTIKP